MKIENLPIIVVSDVQSQPPQLKGKVNKWHWVGENHFAYLYLAGDKIVEGKFRNVDENTKTVFFVFTDSNSAPTISPGESISYFDGYWGERALIVFDKTLN